MADLKLWGFDGSTYVRTVKMLLAEKGVTDYEQVQVNVLEGEPKKPEHLARHPFGKVPVLDHDGMRILETEAICNYLNSAIPGKSFIPTDLKARAKMDMVVNMVDSYGYDPVVAGVVGYHLFPDFVGGKDEKVHRQGIEDAKKFFKVIMDLKGGAPFFAGTEPTVADFYVAPLMAYIAMTPHKDEFLALDGVKDWWDRVSALESFKSTAPN